MKAHHMEITTHFDGNPDSVLVITAAKYDPSQGEDNSDYQKEADQLVHFLNGIFCAETLRAVKKRLGEIC